ncbi:MAG TPA: SGNH/GDSL hydrolase family protein [Candidatus Bathyarchaeia archaeon]|nr:SGNH/GDSL hydrolase family protein [Candidatus Bathyarchaeia archaeon]
MRDVWKKLLLLLFSFLIAALLLEIALRVVFYHSLDFSMEMWKYAVNLKRAVPDPNLSFTNLPGGHGFLMGQDVQINSQGLRDREFSLEKPPGVYRILMLGDSTTFGWGVAADETASKILERELNSAHIPGYDRFEVLNAGVGNYDTVQEVTYYKTLGRAFHPDLVVLVYFINDPEPVPRPKNIWLISRSYLVAYLDSRWDGVLRRLGARPDWKAYYSSLYDDNRPGFQACKAALLDLAASTKRDHAKLLVALLPELRQINNDYPFLAAHQKIKDVLRPENVPVVDLIDGLRNHGPESSLWVTPLDDHPSSKAQALIAAQLRDVIIPDLTLAQKAGTGNSQSADAASGK